MVPRLARAPPDFRDVHRLSAWDAPLVTVGRVFAREVGALTQITLK